MFKRVLNLMRHGATLLPFVLLLLVLAVTQTACNTALEVPGGGNTRVRPDGPAPHETSPYARELIRITEDAEAEGQSEPDALYERAQVYMIKYSGRVSELDRIDALLDEALYLDPNHYDALVARARNTYERAHRDRRVDQTVLDEAMAIADEAVALNPSEASAYVVRAGILARKREFEEAHAMVNKAESISGETLRTMLVKGRIYRRERKYNEAFELFSRIMARADENDENIVPRTLGNLASIYRRRRQYDEAEEAYQTIELLAPYLYPYKMDYCDFLLKRGRYADAVAKCEEIQKRLGGDWVKRKLGQAYNGQGLTAYQESEDILEAGPFFEKAVECGREDAETFYLLGLYYQTSAYEQTDDPLAGEVGKRSRMFYKAAEQYQKALKADPQYTDAQEQLQALEAEGLELEHVGG